MGDPTADELFRKLDDRSVKMAALTREINTFVNNTLAKYHELTQSNSKLCADTINRSQSYLQKIEDAPKDEDMKQHRIIVQVFRNVLKDVNTALERCAAIYQSFTDTTQKNEAKLIRLSGELFEIAVEVDHMSRSLKLDAIKSRRCILGVCVDTEKTRQIRALIQKLEDKETTVHAELVQATENSSSKERRMRNTFDNQFKRIRELRGGIDSPIYTIIKVIENGVHNSDIIDIIKGEIGISIAECKIYIAKHKF